MVWCIELHKHRDTVPSTQFRVIYVPMRKACCEHALSALEGERTPLYADTVIIVACDVGTSADAVGSQDVCIHCRESISMTFAVGLFGGTHLHLRLAPST